MHIIQWNTCSVEVGKRMKKAHHKGWQGHQLTPTHSHHGVLLVATAVADGVLPNISQFSFPLVFTRKSTELSNTAPVEKPQSANHKLSHAMAAMDKQMGTLDPAPVG